MTRLVLALTFSTAAAQAAPLELTGVIAADGPAFVLVPFEVPPGTVEVEIAHQNLTPDTILDFGVHDLERFRGWGGGNTESAIIGVEASSRSYLTGPLPPGTWSVVIGKAKVPTGAAQYRLAITLRTSPSLPPQPERQPYTGAVLERTARWYQGDLHVHSRESGDASPSLDAVATFARARGLDFVELSDHNTNAQVDFIAQAQPRHPQLLFVPGVEFTTYAGHANGIGATRHVDHRFGLGEASWERAAQALVEQGAVLSLNHPVLDLGEACIGCAWKLPVPKALVGAIEIQTGGFDKTGMLFSKQAIAFWERQLAAGVRATPVGGSDDHSAGAGTGLFDSAIGSPTTVVFANALSSAALVAGIKAGHTVVKLWGPEDPMVELTAGEAIVGDEVRRATTTLEVRVTGAKAGDQLRLVKNGAALEPTALTGDRFTSALQVSAPPEGVVDRYRAELLRDGQLRTVTGHLWLSAPPAPAPAQRGCSAGGGALGLLVALAGLTRARAARGRR